MPDELTTPDQLIGALAIAALMWAILLAMHWRSARRVHFRHRATMKAIDDIRDGQDLANRLEPHGMLYTDNDGIYELAMRERARREAREDDAA